MTYNKYEHKTQYCLVIFHTSHSKQGSAVLSYKDLKFQSFEGGDNEYYSTIKAKQILQKIIVLVPITVYYNATA